MIFIIIISRIFFYSEESIMKNFLEFLGNFFIFAQNAPFDLKFLNSELIYWKLLRIPAVRFCCTKQIFLEYFLNDPVSKKEIYLK